MNNESIKQLNNTIEIISILLKRGIKISNILPEYRRILNE